MKGTQKKFPCPQCGKVFTAWRPEELPGAPVKCYFCGHQFQDEAAKRPPLKPAEAPAKAEPPPAPAAAPAAPAMSETPAEPSAEASAKAEPN